MNPSNSINKQKVALVLSSGGARGFAHIGVIETLLENNYEISSIAGCSMGSLIGGVYCTGELDKFKEWATGLQKADVFKLYDFTFAANGLVKGEKVFREIQQFLPDRDISELNIPFTAIATDVVDQKEYIFKNGPLYDALRASCAIPGVVKPVEIKGKQLLDGGILNPLPLNLIEKRDDELLVAVNVNACVPHHAPVRSPEEVIADKAFDRKVWTMLNKWLKRDKPATKHPKPEKLQEEKKKFGFFELMLRASDMMQDRLTDKMVELYPPHMLVNISRKAGGTFEYYRAEEFIEAGRQATLSALTRHQLIKNEKNKSGYNRAAAS